MARKSRKPTRSRGSHKSPKRAPARSPGKRGGLTARQRSLAAKRGWKTRRAKVAKAKVSLADRLTQLEAVAQDPATPRRAAQKARALAARLRGVMETMEAIPGATPQPPQEFGPRVEVKPGVRFPDHLFAKSGAQLLGFLEGRPGVVRITTVDPQKPAFDYHPNPENRVHTRDASERIRNLPMVVEAQDDPDEQEEILDSIWAAWEEAEDGGAIVEVEVDYEEAT